MSTEQCLKDKLLETVLNQIITDLDVELSDSVYIDTEKISDELTAIVLGVLREEDVREVVREKVRAGIEELDPKLVAKALEPEVSRSLISKLFRK